MTEAEVRAALNGIIDPCSAVAGAPAGLDEMGLIRQLRVSGADVEVTIGVTEPGCMMGASFVARAQELLDGMDGIATADVRLDHAMDWEPSDLDPTYAKRLEQMRVGVRDRLSESAPSNALPVPPNKAG